jgi:transcriptional regulator with XRE-family HTH domain
MPSIDEGAKAYEMGLAARFGVAVSTRRKALKLTASELARRTAELGYPISRGAIAKIESNSRSGKIDVAELLVLSAALDIPPVLLLVLIFPTGTLVEVLPGVEVRGDEAVRWLSGRTSFPRKVDADGSKPAPPNDGVKLIAAAASVDKALEERIPLVNQLQKAEEPREVEVAQRMLQINDEQVEGMLQELSEAQRALWGFLPPPSSDSLPPEHESDG